MYWQIYLVFTIAYLKSCPNPALDHFERADILKQPDFLFVEENTDITRGYKIIRIILHRNTQRIGVGY